MRKYGIENFKIEVLCSGLTKEKANELEQFYIQKEDTLGDNGYNLTYGGEGTIYLSDADKQRIIDLYTKEKMSQLEIKEKTGHDQKTIREILRTNDIKIRGSKTYLTVKRTVYALDKKTGKQVYEFENCYEAALFLGSPHPEKNHILQCIQGKRKSTLGYCWR